MRSVGDVTLNPSLRKSKRGFQKVRIVSILVVPFDVHFHYIDKGVYLHSVGPFGVMTKPNPKDKWGKEIT